MTSPFSRAAWILPVVITFGSVIVGFSAPVSSGDWLGLQKFVMMYWGLIFAGGSALVCSVLSYRLMEPKRSHSILPAILGTAFLLVSGVLMTFTGLESAKESRSVELFREYRSRFEEDPSLIVDLSWETIVDEERRAASVVFDQVTPDFSQTEIERIYAEAPELRYSLLKNYSLREKFFDACLTEASNMAVNGNPRLLRAIAANSRTPKEVLSAIRDGEEFGTQARTVAKVTLERIGAEPQR